MLQSFTFVVVFIFDVSGEGHQVPAGPGADQGDGGTVGALWTFLPLTHVGELHALKIFNALHYIR